MNLKNFFRLSFVCALIIVVASCKNVDHHEGSVSETDFSFVFMTDIHLKPESLPAFGMVIDTINKMDVDFVLTGGDLVYDVLRGNKVKSDALFDLYKEASAKINVPVYHCIGNHELFGIYEESVEDSLHPDYLYGMYERHLGKTYYSFDHKGWHFVVLNSIEEENQRYVGSISKEQLDWLQQDLKTVDQKTPIAFVSHIPLVSTFPQIYPKPSNVGGYQGLRNQDQLMEIVKNHNLKLVLQGHLHWLEDLNVMGKTRYITGGAIAGRPSWKGKRHGEEGFLKIKVIEDEISWEFIDYGWDNPS
jgi:3',5'-cyclic AMP phosphodiesterase CpdA